MKTLLEKYLNLDKDFVHAQLNASLTIKDFWKRLGVGECIRRTRGLSTFEEFFEIDIVNQVQKNIQRQKQFEHNQIFTEDRICKNPECNKHFTWNDHPYSNFCSKSCAAKYSSMHVNSKNISKALSKSVKAKVASERQRKLYICRECENEFYSKDSTSNHCKRGFCSNECYLLYREKHPIKHAPGGKRHGSGRGKKGWYKGYYCDSTWELAWVIYQLDHGVKFQRNTEWFPYEFKGQQRKYYPDFIMNDGSYSEIKGWSTDEWKAKIEQFPKDKIIHVFYKDDLEEIFEYIKETYKEELIYLYDDSKPEPIKDISKQKYIWLHRNGKNTIVHPFKYQSMINAGWEIGRIKDKSK